MITQGMTNKAIAAEIGQRIDQLRLEQNLTQQQLADEIGISRISYRKLVQGSAKFENIIAALRALHKLDLVEKFIPEQSLSPMQLLKIQGKQRQRASNKKAKKEENTSSKPDSNLDW